MITWTPRHPFRQLGTGLAPNKGSVSQDSCPAQHCKPATKTCTKSYDYTFSSDHGWFQNSSPWLFSEGPVAQGYPLLKSVGRCEHWVTAMDDMGTPCLLVSLVAGWMTITMEVIISHWKWEHSLDYLQCKTSKCHKEMPFPQYNIKQHWNPVQNY